MHRFFNLRLPLHALLFLSIAGFAPVLFSASHPDESAEKWFIDPSGKAGAITRAATEAEFIRQYGAKNVKRDAMDVGEGETEPATFLFPDDPDLRLAISWKDAEKRAYPSRIQIDGDASRWHTLGNVTLGTSLKELEKLNAGHFLLAGFGWDYSGTVTSWENGKLDEVFGHRRVWLRLNPTENNADQTPEYQLLLGDKDFSSAEPGMQKLNPQVYQIIWVFN